MSKLVPPTHVPLLYPQACTAVPDIWPLSPRRGLSILDKVDKEFEGLEANFAFFETLKRNLKPDVEVKEVDAHITDAVFADKAAEILWELAKEQ